jgi:quercetin dioxygenase-like cupin family protein
MKNIAMRRATLGLALGLPLVLSAGTSAAQAPAPPKGFNTTGLANVDLGPEIEGMQGRVLRMSTTTVDPGGVMPLHPHKDRPEIIFVAQGTLTELRDGKATEYGPGSVLVMTHDTIHGLENRGKAPVIYIATPILKKQ